MASTVPEKTEWKPGEVIIREGCFDLATSPTGKATLWGARCKKCGQVQFPIPGDYCPARCTPEATLEKTALKPYGILRSWTSVERSFPGIECPYLLALVELADGPWIVCHLADCKPKDIDLDIPVELTIRQYYTHPDTGEKVFGYAFRPTGK